MKSLIVLVALLGLAAAYTELEYQTRFTQWMHQFGKVYSTDEFHTRFAAFRANMDFVAEWNARNSTTVLGLNLFADLTNEEYRRTYLGTKIDGTARLAAAGPHKTFLPMAATVDWRAKGAVTPIKNQGQCGSCWSFSTTGSIEGIHQIKTGNLVSLSEQNLMDCSIMYGNLGCNGGLMDNAFKYVIANKGIDTEASYPYQAKLGLCHYNAANLGATISGYTDVQSGNENALASANNNQPISVAIDASHNSFQLYSSGVYYEPQCSSTSLDHGVLVVGYGSDSGDYWIVKNSWGTSWGEQGFIQMSRNRNNNCGIATSASYPSV